MTAVIKKAKGTKKCVIKLRHKFEDVTEKVSKIALSSNDDRRLQNLIELRHMYIVQVLEKSAKHNCYNFKKLKYKMINFDDVAKESKTEHWLIIHT